VLWLPRLFGGDEVEDHQKTTLKVLVEEAKRATEFARQWRNQRVADVDLDRARDVAMGGEPDTPLDRLGAPSRSLAGEHHEEAD